MKVRIINMEILKNSDNRLVESILAFATADAGKLCHDSAKEEEMTHDEVEDAFKRGKLVIMLESKMYIPTSYEKETNAAKITCVYWTGTAAAAYTFYSKEKEE